MSRRSKRYLPTVFTLIEQNLYCPRWLEFYEPEEEADPIEILSTLTGTSYAEASRYSDEDTDSLEEFDTILVNYGY